MKKIHNYQAIVLSPVKMYWDDLEEIYNRIERGRTVEVKSGEYKFDSLNELKEKTKKNYINQIELIGRGENYHDNISIRISSGEAWVHQDAETTETAAKIKEILSNNSPWYMYSPNSPAWYILTGALGWIAILILGFFSAKVENIYLSIMLAVIGLGIMFWALKSKPILGGTKIYTCLRKDNVNFWERNKDQFFRDLVIALIAGFISFLLYGYLLPN